MLLGGAKELGGSGFCSAGPGVRAGRRSVSKGARLPSLAKGARLPSLAKGARLSVLKLTDSKMLLSLQFVCLSSLIHKNDTGDIG